jgi:hypothetical protein
MSFVFPCGVHSETKLINCKIPMNARHLQKRRARVGPAPRGQQGPDDLESQPHHSENGPTRGPGKNHLAPAGALGVGVQCPFQPTP